MKPEEAIGHIESLYPADSEYEDTAEIGIRLLTKAKRETMASWRDLPTNTLIRYAQLCIQKEDQH
ncbi:hypothetical protein ACFQ1M_09835 [Sungkyunkwania multivorans]|uniref:Uncharacterized protein n=1 Tax=Sungkyunkwania multivorans TaxID=1173618 RepID=A0ABW3CZI2_9FLAO